MSILLTDSQQVRFGFLAVTAAGNRALIENVEVESSDPAILAVSGPDADGMFTATVSGLLGTVQLNAKADVQIGAGEEWIYGTAQVEVVPGRAVAINFNFGEPLEK
jgi:hypothetical protein